MPLVNYRRRRRCLSSSVFVFCLCAVRVLLLFEVRDFCSMLNVVVANLAAAKARPAYFGRHFGVSELESQAGNWGHTWADHGPHRPWWASLGLWRVHVIRVRVRVRVRFVAHYRARQSWRQNETQAHYSQKPEGSSPVLCLLWQRKFYKDKPEVWGRRGGT